MSKPLAGIKVIEIGQEIQGPFAALFLADLGAEIVKIENKETGDISRWMFTSVIGGPGAKNPMVSHYFLAMNRGKRSIAADLKKPEAAEIVRRMAKTYDVLVTNYRPGVLDRLGLGYEDLRAINPRLVYAQGSSWGPKGPWVTRPSRDTLAQAASGLMAKNGMPSDPPLPAGILLADHAGGLTLAGGILAALVARERTGNGQKVDASIYGTMIALQGMEIDYTSLTGQEPERAGRGHQFLHGVWGSYPTSDGYICLAGVDEKRWPDFCRILGIQHIEKDPDISGGVVRNFHGDKIQAVLDEIFPRKTSREWLDELHDADILATEVVDYTTVLQSEQARANGYLLELDHPAAGKILVSGGPVSINSEINGEAKSPPELGQHTEEVMIELGYTWEEIAAIRETGAIL
ncbi:MAG TPA: CoA transferase [Candidatus Binataceae bacterium]|nr:CoA transferase [Candidatus Binataceae bacterium]